MKTPLKPLSLRGSDPPDQPTEQSSCTESLTFLDYFDEVVRVEAQLVRVLGVVGIKSPAPGKARLGFGLGPGLGTAASWDGLGFFAKVAPKAGKRQFLVPWHFVAMHAKGE